MSQNKGDHKPALIIPNRWGKFNASFTASGGTITELISKFKEFLDSLVEEGFDIDLQRNDSSWHYEPSQKEYEEFVNKQDSEESENSDDVLNTLKKD